LYTRLSL